MAGDSVIDLLRKLCSALPETTERPSHGEAAWFVRDAKLFVMAAERHHDDRVAFWCAAPPGVQESLVRDRPEEFFRPPYVGHRGWLGVYLDVEDVDWAMVDECVREAYLCVAPKKLAALVLAENAGAGAATLEP